MSRYPVKWPQSTPRFTLLDDFTSGWTQFLDGGTFSVTNVTDYVKTGTQSIRLSVGDGTGVGTHQGTARKAVSLDMRDAYGNNPRSFLAKIFCNVGQAQASNISLRILFYSSATDYYSINLNGGGGVIGASDQITYGWNNFIATDQDSGVWTSSGSPNWAAITSIRVFASLTAGYTGRNPFIFTVDSIHYSHSIKNTAGIFSITLDDSTPVQKDICDRLFGNWGFNATLYNIYDAINTGGLTTAQLQALKADGHDLQIHGGGASHGGANWCEQADNGAAEIQDLLDFYAANNLMPDALHASYPEGAFNETVISVLQSKNIVTARSIAGVTYLASPLTEPSKQFLSGNHITEAEVADPYQLQTRSIEAAGAEASGIAYLKNFVNQRGGWGNVYTHGWPFGGLGVDPAHTVFDSFFGEVYAMANDGLFEVLPVITAWNRLGKSGRMGS